MYILLVIFFSFFLSYFLCVFTGVMSERRRERRRRESASERRESERRESERRSESEQKTKDTSSSLHFLTIFGLYIINDPETLWSILEIQIKNNLRDKRTGSFSFTDTLNKLREKVSD